MIHSGPAKLKALRRQRRVGLAFLSMGVGAEMILVALVALIPPMPIGIGMLYARALAVLGLLLAAYASTGSAAFCLVALAPVPILPPMGAWGLVWLHARSSARARAASRLMRWWEIVGFCWALLACGAALWEFSYFSQLIGK